MQTTVKTERVLLTVLMRERGVQAAGTSNTPALTGEEPSVGREECRKEVERELYC